MYTQKNNIYKYIKVYFHTSYYNILYINDHAGAVYIYINTYAKLMYRSPPFFPSVFPSLIGWNDHTMLGKQTNFNVTSKACGFSCPLVC